MGKITITPWKEAILETKNASRWILKHVEIRSWITVKINWLWTVDGVNNLRGHDGIQTAW